MGNTAARSLCANEGFQSVNQKTEFWVNMIQSKIYTFGDCDRYLANLQNKEEELKTHENTLYEKKHDLAKIACEIHGVESQLDCCSRQGASKDDYIQFLEMQQRKE